METRGAKALKRSALAEISPNEAFQTFCATTALKGKQIRVTAGPPSSKDVSSKSDVLSSQKKQRKKKKKTTTATKKRSRDDNTNEDGKKVEAKRPKNDESESSPLPYDDVVEELDAALSLPGGATKGIVVKVVSEDFQESFSPEGLDDDEEERLPAMCGTMSGPRPASEEFRVGGYHRVEAGDILDDRYRAMECLGHGGFASVTKCVDMRDQRVVAIKIPKAGANYASSTFGEIVILETIRKKLLLGNTKKKKKVSLIELRETFFLAGPSGNHACLVFDLLDKSLLDFIDGFGCLTTREAKVVSKQLLDALDFLHRDVGVVHADLKPENVMLKLRKREDSDRRCTTDVLEVRVVDFGLSFFIDPRRGPRPADVGTNEYRSPEQILNHKTLSSKIDLWALACTIFEVSFGVYLFESNEAPKPAAYGEDELQLCTMIELLGPIPTSVLKKGSGRVANWFDLDSGDMNHLAPDEPDAMIDVINRLKVHPDNPHLSTFLLACLEYDPERRADAKTALDHPWLNDTNPDVGGQVHIVDVGDV